VVYDVDNVCSGQFGDGRGGISYVGPCDAQARNDQNVVEIELVDLYTGDPAVALASDEYRNPCPVGGGQCKLSVACEENADAAVVSNLTVMRDAIQCFFDIAVNFEGIFCSAKVDCLAEPLVFDPMRSGARAWRLRRLSGPLAARGSTSTGCARTSRRFGVHAGPSARTVRCHCRAR